MSIACTLVMNPGHRQKHSERAREPQKNKTATQSARQASNSIPDDTPRWLAVKDGCKLKQSGVVALEVAQWWVALEVAQIGAAPRSGR